ncbi:carbon-nitrogen hydrolase family protein [Silicimonas algicola]|uniref:Putative amidohydrolase n=1 Tax=Silicimonas algicola TaxID=1826607 RepID=A0A316G6E7_9RHOB|nr:carbon-nitrogen hydrolase family protein [Silicimonas algicola]AZQ69419.1 carbon-nitrogen hydrolase family protein [Silicimonas algicola]PWK56484.1 putative amidohydrolase [Silicimonas algicola]
MRVALLQTTSTDDPGENISMIRPMIAEAAVEGARFILTPEVTNCVSASRPRQADVLRTEDEDTTLAALRDEAARRGVWLLIGSLALKQAEGGRFVNRSFLVTPQGEIAARYDKIHMFDVTISETETYRESEGYRPGDRAVVAEVEGVKVGLTICYDVRFPHLYRDLAKAGARILTVPSAFSPATGAAHWEVLLRARAIENGCFVLAPAQCGTHPRTDGRERRTHGHSLAVDPWGQVLSDSGTAPSVRVVDLDLDAVDDVRRRLPSLSHDRDYSGP